MLFQKNIFLLFLFTKNKYKKTLHSPQENTITIQQQYIFLYTSAFLIISNNVLVQ